MDMMMRGCFSFFAAGLFALLLAAGPVSAAMAVTVSQSGADSGEVMKAREFIVDASGWGGTCSQAMISFTGCSSCSLSGEGIQKTIGQASSVSWTTVVASQKAVGQTVSVSVSAVGDCSGSGISSSFDIVLPPSLTLDATTSSSSVSKGGSFSVNLDISNGGETTASDLTIDTTTSGFSASCAPISSIDEGQSAGESCTVTALSSITGGSKTVTLQITSSNADSTSDTVSITVNSKAGDGICDPGESGTSDCTGNGGPGGNGGSFGGLSSQNASSRPTLVPGVGLRNNTKLQAAIEKVLAKGSLSDQARENLLRLSVSITSDFSMTRWFNVSGGKSKITTTMKYTGQEKANNLMLFESVPKAFASNASLVTVSAPGGTVEVAEDDPSWVILYPEMSPNQEITVTYEVSGSKSSTVLNNMNSEVYAESLGVPTAAGLCTAGAKRCSGNDLQQCSSDGSKWDKLQTCNYGCDSSTLSCKGIPGGLVIPPTLDVTTIIIIVVVLIVAGLVVGAFFVYKKKNLGKKEHFNWKAAEDKI